MQNLKKNSILVLEEEYKTLERLVSDYYKSVEDLFFYRRKNQWKRMFSVIVALLGLTFLIFNVIPFFPLFNAEEYMFPVYEWVQKETELFDNTQFSFWIAWALGVLLSSSIFAVLFIPVLYWKRKKRKFLDSYLLLFCYSYLLEKEIKSYLINENEVHLENVVDYFKRIVNNFSTLYLTDESGGTSSVKLKTLSEALAIQKDVVELSSKSKRYIEALDSMDQKVIARMKKKIEISKILPLIECLTFYHFSIIKPQEKFDDGEELKNKRALFVEAFIEKLQNLEPLQLPTDGISRTSIIENLTEKISGFFSHSNVFVLFISWFLLFLTILFPLAFSMIIALGVDIDSTILIGILTTPFIGAVTMVGIITNQKKNQ